MFYSDKFTFAGIPNDEMEVSLVSMDVDILNEYGINFSQDISKVGTSNNPIYSISDTDTDTIQISLCYEINNEAMPWTIQKRAEIISWMVQDEFMPFVSEDDPDIIYYFKCVGYTKEFNLRNKGVITFEMKPYSPYAYVSRNTRVVVSGNYNLNLTNISNVDNLFSPIFKITTKRQETIEIGTLTINVENGDVIVVDNGMNTITNSNEKSMISNSNRKWVRLTRGNNQLVMKGNFDIEIDCLFPIMV